MSFLSSHRLHWGVHHELSDNFMVHLDKMVHDATNAAVPSGESSAMPTPASANTSLNGGLPAPHSLPSPEALGP